MAHNIWETRLNCVAHNIVKHQQTVDCTRLTDKARRTRLENKNREERNIFFHYVLTIYVSFSKFPDMIYGVLTFIES